MSREKGAGSVDTETFPGETKMKMMKPVLALAVAAAFAFPAQAAEKTLSTDIVVIGAGCGGTAAGVAAIEKGAKVIMLE